MKFSLLISIVSEELEEKAIKVAREAGAGGVTILEGRGSGLEEKKTFFGLTFEGSQSLLVFVLERKLSMRVLRALNSELELQTDTRAIAFSVPVDHVAGIDLEQVRAFEESIKEEI